MVSVENKKRIQQRIEGLLLAQRATGLLIDEWMMIGALQMLLQIWQKDGDEEWVGSALFLHFFLTYHVQFVITQIKFLILFHPKTKKSVCKPNPILCFERERERVFFWPNK